MKNYILILFFCFLVVPTFAQPKKKKSVEIGLFMGGSYYIGDLNPIRHFDQYTKPGGGVVVRYNFNPRLAARANFLLGKIEGRDDASSSLYQQQRNLNFQTSVTEVSTQLEFNFLNYAIGDETAKFSPYIFGGIGAFYFDPYGEINDEWVALKPLSTEGQGLPDGSKSYSLFQISLPFGVGIKMNVAKNMSLGLEWGMRKTFTDYLDDVSTRYYNPAILEQSKGKLAAMMSDPSKEKDPNYSNVGRQRGNPTNKDWYSFAGIVFTIRLKGKEIRCPGVYD